MSDYSGGNESRYLHYPPPQIHPSKTAAPSAVFIFLHRDLWPADSAAGFAALRARLARLSARGSSGLCIRTALPSGRARSVTRQRTR
jgi:hypothetical protein